MKDTLKQLIRAKEADAIRDAEDSSNLVKGPMKTQIKITFCYHLLHRCITSSCRPGAVAIIDPDVFELIRHSQTDKWCFPP